MEKISSHDLVQNLFPERLVDGLVPQIRKRASEDVTEIPLEIDHGLDRGQEERKEWSQAGEET